MRKKLKNFFNPKTIAVVGASENPIKVGGVLMEKLKNFSGKIIPINVKREIILGKETYASIKEYSGKIDLVVIAIPAKIVGKILIECGEVGIKNVIIISAGFSEVGNKEGEKKIVSLAEKYGINILGPNCFGVANPFLNLDLTFSNTSPKKGNISLISQSGALWSYVSDFRNVNFSGFVSLGNMAGLDFSDFIEYFSYDKNTRKIVLYVEKLKDGRRFIDVCKKSGKEILVVKAGKTEKGRKAAISHTASLATDFEIYRGVFSQAGVKLIDSLANAIGKEHEDISSALKGKEVAIVTNAGGGETLITDYLESSGFNIGSSIDLLGTALAKNYKMELENKKYEKFDSIVVILTPQKMSEPEKTAQVLVDSKYNKKIVACFLGEKSVAEANKILKKNKIPVFNRAC